MLARRAVSTRVFVAVISTLAWLLAGVGPAHRAFAASQKSGALRFLGADTRLGEPVELAATDVTTIETLQSAPLLTLSLPGSSSRTYLFVQINSSFHWEQVTSGQPVHFRGFYDLVLSSPALPSPGTLGLGASSMGGRTEVSTFDQDVSHFVGFTRGTGYDLDFLGRLLESAYSLDPDTARQLARGVLASDTVLTVTARVTLRSVERWQQGGNRRLEVWGE